MCIRDRKYRIPGPLNGYPNLKASQVTSTGFEESHGIRQLQIKGKKLCGNSETVLHYQKNLIAHINKLCLSTDQILCIIVMRWDYTGKLFHKKMMASGSESSAERRMC